jgi:hypothetical protein
MTTTESAVRRTPLPHRANRITTIQKTAMKKTYSTPAGTAVRLRTEGLMATSSLYIKDGSSSGESGTTTKVESDGQVLSGKGNGASSGIWSNMED